MPRNPLTSSSSYTLHGNIITDADKVPENLTSFSSDFLVIQTVRSSKYMTVKLTIWICCYLLENEEVKVWWSIIIDYVDWSWAEAGMELSCLAGEKSHINVRMLEREDAMQKNMWFIRPVSFSDSTPFPSLLCLLDYILNFLQYCCITDGSFPGYIVSKRAVCWFVRFLPCNVVSVCLRWRYHVINEKEGV